HPVTVISVRDVVDFLVDHFPREIMNLPADLRDLAEPTLEFRAETRT
ncbi:MAG: hypothetical protein JRF70_00810, partial [Deltaproteobacteria bacterium]|nr:hypothetical protein [Deltaproteobacteria bacterium]